MTLRRCGRPRHLQQINRHRQGHLGKGPDLESPDANQKSWRDALAKKRERREFAIHSPGKHEENVCCAPLLGATQPVFQKMKQPAKGRHAAQAYIQDPASRKRLSAAGPACCSKAPGRASERVATSGCSAAPLPAERPHACEKKPRETRPISSAPYPRSRLDSACSRTEGPAAKRCSRPRGRRSRSHSRNWSVRRSAPESC